MNKRWDPRIYAAQAAAHNRFCFALTEIEFDDQFSAIIEFDGNLTQPWARTDVSREIFAVVDLDKYPDLLGRYAALSSEGNFYVLAEGTPTDKIAGAGLLSPGSSGAGLLTAMTRSDDVLWAVGFSQQVYRKHGGQIWQRIPFDLPTPSGFGRIELGPVAAAGDTDVYVCGLLNPMRADIDSETEKRLVATNASNAEWKAALAEAKQRIPNLPTSDEGRVFHWNGVSFQEIHVPVEPETLFRSVFVETPDRIWIGGTEGTLLMGNARNGFHRVGRFSDDQDFFSVTKFRDTYVIASEDTIVGFDGSSVRRFDLPFHHTPLRPMKVQAVDDVLFYFDYQEGIHLFDGTAWQEIKVPTPLYQRSFNGLR